MGLTQPLSWWARKGKERQRWSSESLLGFMKASPHPTPPCAHTHVLLQETLILHVVFPSFQQKEVRSWVVSLDNVIFPFTCAPSDRDCSFSCSTPAPPAFLPYSPSSAIDSVRPVHLAPASQAAPVENTLPPPSRLALPFRGQESQVRRTQWRIYGESIPRAPFRSKLWRTGRSKDSPARLRLRAC